MIKRNFKGRCRKWKLEKCKDVMRAYSDIQAAYAKKLEREDEVNESLALLRVEKFIVEQSTVNEKTGSAEDPIENEDAYSPA